MAPRIKDFVILLITKSFANIANTQSGGIHGLKQHLASVRDQITHVMHQRK